MGIACRGDPHGELRGQNVLTRIGTGCPDDLSELAEEVGVGGGREGVERILEECRRALFEVRQGRPRPHLDDKIIASWNGLMIR